MNSTRRVNESDWLGKDPHSVEDSDWLGTFADRSWQILESSGSRLAEWIKLSLFLYPMRRREYTLRDLNPYKRKFRSLYNIPASAVETLLPYTMTSDMIGDAASPPPAYAADPLHYMSPDPRCRQMYKCTYCFVREDKEEVAFVMINGYLCDTCGLALPEYYILCTNCYELFFPQFTCFTCLAHAW